MKSFELFEHKEISILDSYICGKIKTKKREYKLISSGRYPWIKGECMYKNTLEEYLNDVVKFLDKLSVGDIVNICHKEPFSSEDFIITSDDMLIDNYGVGFHAMKIEFFRRYSRSWIRNIECSLIDDVFSQDISSSLEEWL